MMSERKDYVKDYEMKVGLKKIHVRARIKYWVTGLPSQCGGLIISGLQGIFVKREDGVDQYLDSKLTPKFRTQVYKDIIAHVEDNGVCSLYHRKNMVVWTDHLPGSPTLTKQVLSKKAKLTYISLLEMAVLLGAEISTPIYNRNSANLIVTCTYAKDASPKHFSKGDLHGGDHHLKDIHNRYDERRTMHEMIVQYNSNNT